MSKSVKLLLIENVEGQGIVGDVVNVRSGFARNYLLPRNLATQPSDEKIKELAGKRADAQKLLELQRKQRVELNDKLKGIELTLTRACNDQGILYGAITQQEIAASLKELGHIVSPRDVRITQTIKRVDNFDVHIKLDSDLDQVIKLHVKADRDLPQAKGEEHHPEQAPTAPGAEGQKGEPGKGEHRKSEQKGDGEGRRRRDMWLIPDESSRVVGWGSGKKDEAKASDSAKGEKKGKGEKAPKADTKAEGKPEAKAEKAEKADKGGEKAEKKAPKKKAE